MKFLTKYGYGYSREYFLVVGDETFDSKAIFAAAYGYQYPERGAPKSSQFSGGEATVQRRLEALGFVVERRNHIQREEFSHPQLVRYQAYSRQEVHDLLDPTVPFTPNAGMWGISGIVSLSGRPNDFVFFVTLEKHTGYADALSTTGLVEWDSQRKQNLDDDQIHRFVKHDHELDSILLLLRAHEGEPYCYVGKLRYVWHDTTSEHPVHFRWQVLDWQIEPIRAAGLLIEHGTAEVASIPAELPPVPYPTLVEVAPPRGAQQQSNRRKEQKARKDVDYAARDSANRALGRAGEEWVVEHERRILLEIGRPDLAKDVFHAAKDEGDGLGYDVFSRTPSGEPKFIEVKTTRGKKRTPFFITANELSFAEQRGKDYVLYRVFGFSETGQTQYYVLRSPLESALQLSATVHRAVPR
ncbi:MAG TPA: DUF3883 domain-containing protein [Longimicrobium sp.]